MENTREKNKRSDGRKKTYFDRENKKKAVRIEKTKSVAPEKGKQKKSSSSSKCPYQKKCGGCTYLNLSYEEQLAKKEQFLKKTLKGIVPVKGMVGMENLIITGIKSIPPLHAKKTERSYPAFMKRAHTKWFRSMSACSRISVPMPSSAISAVC